MNCTLKFSQLLVVVVCVTVLGGSALAQEPGEPTLAELLGVREQLNAETILEPDREIGTGVSLGTTSTGTLHDAESIPLQGDPVQVLPSHRDRGRNFAASNLHKILRDAASAVDESYPSSLLQLGDVSGLDGGDLSGHASHNCGRDADIGFYVENEAGEAVVPDEMIRFDEDGIGPGGLRFDLERNWAFVAAAIEHPEVQVQYIFIWDPLRRLLLEHAEQIGVSPEVLERATLILRQPSDSSAHANHYHFRVFCSRRDRVEGCVNRGPEWPWATTHDDAAAARVQRLASVLARSDNNLVERATAFIGNLAVPEAAPHLVEVFVASSPETKNRILDALEWSGIPASASTELVTALHSTKDPRARIRTLQLIGRTGDPGAIPVLARVANEAQEYREARAAANALVRTVHPAAVPALISILDHDHDEVRTIALEGLRYLTNHTGPEEGDLVSWWRAWWSNNKDKTRDQWLVAGFLEVGIEMENIEDAGAIEALIAAQTTAPAHVADNAHRVIMRKVGYWFSPSLDPGQRQERWEKWWARNQWRFLETDTAN